MADKYEVRKIVENRCGEGITNTLYGVYGSIEDIDFSKLPERFVLKCTHDSGGVVICKKRSEFDKRHELQKLKSSLKRNYYWVDREWPYKNIKPRIIAEKYMEDCCGELNDYKVFCFSGVPKVIQVDYDRFTNHKRNLYDTEWNYLGYTTLYPTDKTHVIEKPLCLENVLEYSRRLSADIPFVRVDFYIVDNRPIFGEMTFYHGGDGAFYPERVGL